MSDFSAALLSSKEQQKHIYLPHILTDEKTTITLPCISSPRMLKGSFKDYLKDLNTRMIYGLETPRTLDSIHMNLLHPPNEIKTSTNKDSRFGRMSADNQTTSRKSFTPRVGSQVNKNLIANTDSNMNFTSLHSSIRYLSNRPSGEGFLKTPRNNIPLESFKEQAKKKKKQIREETIIARRIKLLNEMQELRNEFKKKGKVMTTEDLLRKGMVEGGEKKLNKIKAISTTSKLLMLTNKYGRNTTNKHLQPNMTKEFKNKKLKEALQNYLKIKTEVQHNTLHEVREDHIPSKLLRNYF